MRKIKLFGIGLVAGLLTVLVYSCNNSDEKHPVPQICLDPSLLKMPPGYDKRHKYTLVFLDYTDPRIVGVEAKKAIFKEVSSGLATPGDRIDLYLITANTATRTTVPVFSFNLDIKPRAELIPHAGTDSIYKSRIYACRWLQAIDSAERMLGKALDLFPGKPDAEPYDNSDIAGLLYIANREFKKYDESTAKTLFIVSDLEQNCPGFFELYGTAFSTEKNIAKGDADRDFKQITTSISAQNFRGVDVKLHKGDLGELRSNNDVQNKLMLYWEKLFAHFGMKINSTIE